MLIEIFLEFFVGVVDVKLFEPVHLQEEGQKNEFTRQGSEFTGKIHLIWSVSDQKTCNHLKVLEAKDVEDSDGLEVFLSFDFLVDFHYDPGKTLGIKCHGNGVS